MPDSDEYQHDDDAGIRISVLPAVVLQALRDGRSIIPIQGDKKPANGFPWTRYQYERASVEDVELWDSYYYGRTAWAIVTGEISGVVVLDFDGDEGRKTLAKLGLAPHVESPRGAHVYVRHPGWRVATRNSQSDKGLGQQFRGLDIKGDGGYAIFAGASQHGTYRHVSDHAPYSVDDLSPELVAALKGERQRVVREAVREPLQEPRCENVDCTLLLQRALDKAQAGEGRNNSGAWLAQQLRDAGLSQDGAKVIMLRYVEQAPERDARGELAAYTEREALDSLRSAYSRSPRDPWDALGSDTATSSEDESPQPRRFRVKSVADLEAEGPLTPVIEGIFYQDTVNLLYGPSGDGKSFIALDQGLSVAAGVPWHGHEVQQGAVVYVVAEGRRGIPQRVRAWQLMHPEASDENFYIIDDAPQLSERRDVDALIAALKGLPTTPVLVYVDTLAQTFGDGDENSTQHMTRYLNGAQRIQRTLGAAVVIIHHTGRNGDTPRGNSALDAALQTVMMVKAQGKGIRFSCEKQKDHEEFPTKWFQLESVSLTRDRSSAVPRLVAAPSPVVKINAVDALSLQQRKVFDALLASGPQGVTQAEIVQNTGVAKQTVSAVLSILVKRGLAQNREDGGKTYWTAASEVQSEAA